jgi:2-oxoglutarate ferredoxin oxidoreductase subunit alpha
VAIARRRGLAVKLLVPYLLYPVAEEVFNEFFAGVEAGLVVELSHQGQLYRLLRMYAEMPKGVRSLCRSGAAPFLPGELVRELQQASLAV